MLLYFGKGSQLTRCVVGHAGPHQADEEEDQDFYEPLHRFTDENRAGDEKSRT
jgi:hypothetical protein